MSTVKIVSDGTAKKTTVTVDGRRLDGVTKATWELEAGTGYAIATLTVFGVEVDIEAADPKVVEA